MSRVACHAEKKAHYWALNQINFELMTESRVTSLCWIFLDSLKYYFFVNKSIFDEMRAQHNMSDMSMSVDAYITAFGEFELAHEFWHYTHAIDGGDPPRRFSGQLKSECSNVMQSYVELWIGKKEKQTQSWVIEFQIVANPSDAAQFTIQFCSFCIKHCMCLTSLL